MKYAKAVVIGNESTKEVLDEVISRIINTR